MPKENPVAPTEVVHSGHVELSEAPAEREVKEGTQSAVAIHQLR